MTGHGRREVARRVDALVAPFVALGFSLLVAFLAPRYGSWVGPLPAFAKFYFGWWPAWIALNALAAAVHVLVDAMELEPGKGRFWRNLDTMLGVLSASSVLAGIVALVMPALHIRYF